MSRMHSCMKESTKRPTFVSPTCYPMHEAYRKFHNFMYPCHYLSHDIHRTKKCILAWQPIEKNLVSFHSQHLDLFNTGRKVWYLTLTKPFMGSNNLRNCGLINSTMCSLGMTFLVVNLIILPLSIVKVLMWYFLLFMLTTLFSPEIMIPPSIP